MALGCSGLHCGSDYSGGTWAGSGSSTPRVANFRLWKKINPTTVLRPRLTDLLQFGYPAFLTPARYESAEGPAWVRCATRDRGPRKRTVGYVEEAGGTRLRVGGTRFAGRAVRPDHCADAVEEV